MLLKIWVKNQHISSAPLWTTQSAVSGWCQMAPDLAKVAYTANNSWVLLLYVYIYIKYTHIELVNGVKNQAITRGGTTIRNWLRVYHP